MGSTANIRLTGKGRKVAVKVVRKRDLKVERKDTNTKLKRKGCEVEAKTERTLKKKNT